MRQQYTILMPRLVGAALPIVLAICGVQASAQTPAVCHGPAEIERALAKQASANAYNALGAWFAQRNQINCAIPAFRSAIHSNPNAWEGHFNLALALLATGQRGAALDEERVLRAIDSNLADQLHRLMAR